LVEEAIESFANQTYPANLRELIVVNDCPKQEYQLVDGKDGRYTGVKIINLLRRFDSLGEKFNWTIGRSRGSIIMPWEDDDISLRDRIKQGVEKLRAPETHKEWIWSKQQKKWVEVVYWKPPQVWYLEGDKLHWQHNVGVRHHASAYHRLLWQSIGGYKAISGAQDAEIDQRMRGWMCPSYPRGVPPEEWHYVYRWSVSPWHLSGAPKPDEYYASLRDEPNILSGLFLLRPHWRSDYDELCREKLASDRRSASSPSDATGAILDAAKAIP
jgi:hypothetical protein